MISHVTSTLGICKNGLTKNYYHCSRITTQKCTYILHYLASSIFNNFLWSMDWMYICMWDWQMYLNTIWFIELCFFYYHNYQGRSGSYKRANESFCFINLETAGSEWILMYKKHKWRVEVYKKRAKYERLLSYFSRFKGLETSQTYPKYRNIKSRIKNGWGRPSNKYNSESSRESRSICRLFFAAGSTFYFFYILLFYNIRKYTKSYVPPM